MRKTLAVVALSTALTGGVAVLAVPASADTSVVAATQSGTDADAPESDKTGLWGLLGLLGLAGLAKRKETTDTTSARR